MAVGLYFVTCPENGGPDIRIINRADAKPKGPLVVLPPNRLEREYRKKLVRRLRRLAKRTQGGLDELLQIIGGEIDIRAEFRGDSEQSNIRAIVDLFQKIRVGWEPTQEEIEDLARQAGDSVDSQNKRQIRKLTRQTLGVDPFVKGGTATQLAVELADFEKENLRLITKMESEMLDQMEAQILRSVRRGVRAKELEKVVQERLGVGESRAKLIARDQLNKLNGNLNRVRQTGLGFTHYEWQTSEDERVRPEHAERNGQVFAWDQPPSDGHPGEPINCRCVALPVVPEEIEEERPTETVEAQVLDPDIERKFAAFKGPEELILDPRRRMTQETFLELLETASGGSTDALVFSEFMFPDGRKREVTITQELVRLPDDSSVLAFRISARSKGKRHSIDYLPGLDQEQREAFAAIVSGRGDPLLDVHDTRPLGERFGEFVSEVSETKYPTASFDLEPGDFPEPWLRFLSNVPERIAPLKTQIALMKRGGFSPKDAMERIAIGERVGPMKMRPDGNFFATNKEVLDMVGARKDRELSRFPFFRIWLERNDRKVRTIEEAIEKTYKDNRKRIEKLRAQGAPEKEIRKSQLRAEKEREQFKKDRESLLDEGEENIASFMEDLTENVENREPSPREVGRWVGKDGRPTDPIDPDARWQKIEDITEAEIKADRKLSELSGVDKELDKAVRRMGEVFGDARSFPDDPGPFRFSFTDDRAHADPVHDFINTGNPRAARLVEPFSWSAVQMHEIAHRLEFKNPVLGEASRRYLLGKMPKDAKLSRINDEPRWTKQPFYDDYAGKVYFKRSGGAEKNKNAKPEEIDQNDLLGTEITPMAVQMFDTNRNIVKLLLQDPDLFWWAISVARGDFK